MNIIHYYCLMSFWQKFTEFLVSITNLSWCPPQIYFEVYHEVYLGDKRGCNVYQIELYSISQLQNHHLISTLQDILLVKTSFICFSSSGTSSSISMNSTPSSLFSTAGSSFFFNDTFNNFLVNHYVNRLKGVTIR